MDIFDKIYYHNTVLDYVTAGSIFLFVIIAMIIINKFVVNRLIKKSEHTPYMWDSLLLHGIKRTVIPLIIICTLYFVIGDLNFPRKIDNKVHTVFIFLITFFAIRSIISVIKIFITFYIRKKDEGASRQKQLNGIISLISFLIWSLGFIFLLDNLGFKISTVVAGLGISGIAIALAAQAILGDLFSYFVIFFDRPFEIGDFIVVADKMGTVENIGIKTTRLRSLGGEQLIISNTDLTSSRVHNYKRMEKRRVVFNIKIALDTPIEKLEAIPQTIKGIIEAEANTTFDRSHFSAFGDFCFVIENVYYVLTPDYNIYMDIQQKININICKELESRGIKLASSLISKDAG